MKFRTYICILSVLIAVLPLHSAHAVGLGGKEKYLSRAVVCQAMLHSMLDQGHSIPSLSRRNTEDAVRAFTEFSQYILQGAPQEPDAPEFLASSAGASGGIFSAVAPALLQQRIAGIESDYERSSSPDAALRTAGTVISGAQAVQNALENLVNHTKKIAHGAQYYRHVEKIQSVQTGVIITPLLITAAVAANDFVFSPILLGLAAGNLKNIPYWFTIEKNRDNYNWSEAIGALLNGATTGAAPKSWKYISRTDQIPHVLFKAMWDGREAFERAVQAQVPGRVPQDAIVPFVIELYVNVAGLERIVTQSRLTRQGAKTALEMSNVHTDILLYTDEDGVPHLITTFRFDAENIKVKKFQGSTQSEEDKEKDTERELVPAH